MNTLRKHLKALSLGLLIIFFVSAAHSNASALGTYQATSLPNQTQQLQEEAAFPAVAYGLIVVGAFVIGAVNGYYERQSAVNGGSEVEVYGVQHNSNDFSSFDN
ncbi:hypothetical protein E5K00_07005 [Hymenobacter aquaticus]|uniref:DUF4134 domain-containing protein n=1 Tax=Hymenobacter aquaticus TaxID=1867101 RepID=A0A4Z0Q7C8_9BACT|nr:hypothetical protein [Hymenobacter aquaticus]TGE24941.1 hypothetical protein E5K00_07005 [Hymenobacter aquaticus]